MGHSVLVVPVPALDPFVRERTAFYDASFLSADPAFVNSHITLLGPWLPAPTEAELERVAQVLDAVPAFDFHARGVRRVPRRVDLSAAGAGGALRSADRTAGGGLPAVPALRRQLPSPSRTSPWAPPLAHRRPRDRTRGRRRSRPRAVPRRAGRPAVVGQRRLPRTPQLEAELMAAALPAMCRHTAALPTTRRHRPRGEGVVRVLVTGGVRSASPPTPSGCSTSARSRTSRRAGARRRRLGRAGGRPPGPAAGGLDDAGDR